MSLENRNKSQFLGIVVKRTITFRLATDLDRTVKTSAMLTACKAPCSVATKCKQYRLVACSSAVAYVPCKRIGLYNTTIHIKMCDGQLNFARFDDRLFLLISLYKRGILWPLFGEIRQPTTRGE